MRYPQFACALLMSCLPLSALAADLILVRHGNSEHNAANEYNSNPKHPNYRVSNLTALGQEQARKAAQKLLKAGYSDDQIHAVYVSPLPRTQETAMLMAETGLFHPSKIIIDERLIEVRAGDREGLSTDIFPGDHQLRPDAAMYNGETNDDVKHRVMSLYDSIAAQSPDKHVVFVTHGMATRELTGTLTLQPIHLETAESMILPIKKRHGGHTYHAEANTTETANPQG
ncbi:MAG: histidine phosphatase family protein [Pseudomonadota bacterium]